MNYQFLESPIGTLRLVSDGEHIIAIEFELKLDQIFDWRES